MAFHASATQQINISAGHTITHFDREVTPVWVDDEFSCDSRIEVGINLRQSGAPPDY
jgi:hypothetical protein